MPADETDVNIRQSVSALATQLAIKIERYAERYLMQIANIGVSEWRILVHVYDYKHLRLSQISDALNFETAELVSLLSRLNEKHLLRIVEGPSGYIIEPTSVGDGLYRTILPYWIKRQDTIMDGLPEDTMAETLDNLSMLIKHMDRLIEEADTSNDR